jgi:hypothetical protein
MSIIDNISYLYLQTIYANVAIVAIRELGTIFIALAVLCFFFKLVDSVCKCATSNQVDRKE